MFLRDEGKEEKRNAKTRRARWCEFVLVEVVAIMARFVGGGVHTRAYCVDRGSWPSSTKRKVEHDDREPGK